MLSEPIITVDVHGLMVEKALEAIHSSHDFYESCGLIFMIGGAGCFY